MQSELWGFCVTSLWHCCEEIYPPSTKPHNLWFGRRPSFDNILTFGTPGYLRRFQCEHKLAPRGAKDIMLGLAEGFPRETFRGRGLTTDRGPVSPGFLVQTLRLNIDAMRHHVRVSRSFPSIEPSEGHENSEGGKLDNEAKGTEECESDEDLGNGAQEVHVALRKLYKSFNGKSHPLTGSPTRSGRTDDQGSSNIVYTEGHRDKPSRPTNGTANAPPCESVRHLGAKSRPPCARPESSNDRNRKQPSNAR